MHLGLTQQNEKLKFVGRADSQVVTNVVCFRSQPDPLGIVLRFGKLDFAEGSAPQTTPSLRTSAHYFRGNLPDRRMRYQRGTRQGLPCVKGAVAKRLRDCAGKSFDSDSGWAKWDKR